MTISLALLKKVRCRFLCRDSGSPVQGVVASLAVALGEREARIPLGTLRSDVAGYVSFDLAPLIARRVVAVEKLLLACARVRDGEVNLLDSLLSDSGTAAGTLSASRRVDALTLVGRATDINHEPVDGEPGFCLVFPVYVSRPATTAETEACRACATAPLPAIQSPDVCDYRASPFSFVTPVAGSVGDGSCETLVPSSLPLQEHRFYKVIVRRDGEENAADRLRRSAVAAGIEEVSVTHALKTRPPKLKFAEVLEFKQQWRSLGHSLGEIKYSLPLAPGEATQIAIIDWTRQDTASRTDKMFAAEYMDHSLKRDRSIEETVDAALTEAQGGSSFLAGTSGQATLPLQYVTLSFNHAIGGSVSNSWGSRDLAGESLQELHDAIRQQTAYTRSLNSTVIVQASQAEQNVLQTRKIANHNHCHSLTIQYYEVLRHFHIRTAYSGRKKALLVPFEPFAFTWDLALQFRSILEQVLIDRSLNDGFDAILRARIVPSIYDTQPEPPVAVGTPPPPATSQPKTISTTLRVMGVDGEGVGSKVMVQAGDNIRITATGDLTFSAGAFGLGAWSKGPNGDPELAGQSSKFIAPGLKKYSLLYKIGQTGQWRQAGSYQQATADGSGEIVFGVNDESGSFADNKGFGNDYWTVTLEVPSHAVEPSATVPASTDAVSPASAAKAVQVFGRGTDELSIAKLLGHLNGNQGYYNSCVWVLQGAVERRIRLEEALALYPDVLDAIDDNPIAVSGNYVAFPYDGPFPNWQDSHPEAPPAPLDDIVTLPTRGLFAEALLGHCDACEQRDPTRKWDWTEMTTEAPPAIGEVTPGPKGLAPSITPTQLPANVIQITQPPSGPDPAGLAAALKVLGTPDIFHNMSGLDEVSKLLDVLAKESSEANIAALALKAKAKLAQATGDAGGTEAGGKTRTTASESDPDTQIDRLKAIEYARSKGLINDAQGANAAEGVLGGEALPPADGETIDDKITATAIDVGKYCTPAVRAFGPAEWSAGKAANLTGRTTLRAVVSNAPAGSTWQWSMASATAAQIISPSAYITDVIGGDPGLADVTFEVRDPGGTRLGTRTITLSVPQFVVIYEDAAAFDAELRAYQLGDVKATLLQRVRQVVDYLLAKANVRTIWLLAPFKDVLPAHLAPGGFAAGKFSPLTLRGVSPAGADIAGTTGVGGPAVPNDAIDIYPAAFRLNGMDVGADVATAVAKLMAMNMTDPDIKNTWIEIMGRLIGETIAHEIHHAMLGNWPGFANGHNSPAVPFDLLNRGSERSWLQRTGIEILDSVNFPKPGSYRDGGIYAISSLQPGNQTKVDSVFPVPPALL